MVGAVLLDIQVEGDSQKRKSLTAIYQTILTIEQPGTAST